MARYNGESGWARAISGPPDSHGEDHVSDSEPKLIIDTDWKNQAQAEKEKLAAGAAPKGGKGAAGPGEQRELAFEDILSMLATQAMSYMGYLPDPQTGQAIVSLEYAKLYIDMIGLLETKTKGNLTEQEQATMTKMLPQLRMAFVETSEAVAKAVQEGRIKPMGGAPGAPGSPSGGAGSGLVTP